MVLKKKIRFDYFKVYSRSFNEEKNTMEEKKCDLSTVFNQLTEKPAANRTYTVGDDKARLQGLDQSNNKWNLHFVRIRKNGLPIKTHDDGSYGFFDDLEDEEGFGEEVSALYDPDNCVIMIRRNMFSLAPSAISNYLTSFINKSNYTVFFKPLVHPKAAELLEKDHLIRGAEISIADIKNARTSTKKSLGQIINKTDELDESVSIRFKMSVQQKGSKKSSQIPVYEDIEKMAEDPTVNSLEVRRKANEDDNVESVDLIKHRLVDYHDFTEADFNAQSRNILHKTVITRMHMLYRERIDDINKTYI